MKTAEQILSEKGLSFKVCKGQDVVDKVFVKPILAAMEEYASQFSIPEITDEEIEEWANKKPPIEANYAQARIEAIKWYRSELAKRTSPCTIPDITDEEIEREEAEIKISGNCGWESLEKFTLNNVRKGFVWGAKWYRSELKKRHESR